MVHATEALLLDTKRLHITYCTYPPSNCSTYSLEKLTRQLAFAITPPCMWCLAKETKEVISTKKASIKSFNLKY